MSGILLVLEQNELTMRHGANDDPGGRVRKIGCSN